MRNILEKTTSINIIIYDKETYILKKSIFEVNFKKPVFIYIRKKYHYNYKCCPVLSHSKENLHIFSVFWYNIDSKLFWISLHIWNSWYKAFLNALFVIFCAFLVFEDFLLSNMDFAIHIWIFTKELSLCNKSQFSNTYISTTKLCKP